MLNSIPKWMYPILLWLLPEKILGFKTSRILEASPEFDDAERSISKLIEKLQGQGHTEAEAEAAVAQMIAKKRAMSLEEELAWMHRASAGGEF